MVSCRKQWLKLIYIGESSSSSHQRGMEHKKEVRNDNAAHQILIHFKEEHGGVEQKIILRVLSTHRSALKGSRMRTK